MNDWRRTNTDLHVMLALSRTVSYNFIYNTVGETFLKKTLFQVWDGLIRTETRHE